MSEWINTEVATRALIETYDEYIKLLGENELALLGFAVTHGYETPPEAVKRGKQLRERIELLKSHLAE